MVTSGIKRVSNVSRGHDKHNDVLLGQDIQCFPELESGGFSLPDNLVFAHPVHRLDGDGFILCPVLDDNQTPPWV